MSSSSSSPPARTSSSGEGDRRKQSRLQRRAPPLKITPATASGWNAAIPLLSPLAASPTPSSAAVDKLPPPEVEDAAAGKTAPVFKKWQHPAAPFHYETAPLVLPFVPV